MREKHGFNQRNDRLYRIWVAMRQRCSKTYSNSYPLYGARGIKVCPEWDGAFLPFRNWAISNGYADDLSIDRIDSNGDYEPANCRWADIETQNINKRPPSSSKFAEHQGQTLNLSDWARLTGINYTTLIRRYHKGARGDHLFRPVA